MAELAYRHELKFICSELQLCMIENSVSHICRRDKHVGVDGIYTIRSLYFDTYDDRYYYENKMGVDQRKKYRVRIYNGASDIIKLECKYSVQGMKAKEVCNITESQCKRLMQGEKIADIGNEQQLLSRFLVERQQEILIPKVIVEYKRSPYIYHAGNVRITFDKSISSSTRISDFLNPKVQVRGIMPEGMHVMEVKYDDMIPSAVLDCVIRGQNLSRTSFSKYMLCRDYS